MPIKGLTRRGFLKGGVVTAAGAAIAETGLATLAEAADAQKGAPVLGPDAVSITLNVNGKDQSLKVEPRTTLAEALRVKLDMTGT
jgi:xanthine dehydrogenase YagT iron-sulfur-binding subunit